MIKVFVPATSANLGSGYDSLGIALDLYNEIEIDVTDSGLSISQSGDYSRTPTSDRHNLVYRAMERVFEESKMPVPGLNISIKSAIPSTRGLGSSAACIIGGMVGANAIYGKLHLNRILRLACRMEGHPDNVVPCMLGGFTVSAYDGNRVTYVKRTLSDELAVAILWPDTSMSTKKSRTQLPDTVSHKDAAFNVSRSALLSASLITGRFENLRTAMQDKLHQPYRKSLIPHMDEIFAACYQNGAYGCYLSGSGPSLAAFIKREREDEFKASLDEWLKLNAPEYQIHILHPAKNGVRVLKD